MKWIPKFEFDIAMEHFCRPYGKWGSHIVEGGDNKRRVINYWDFCQTPRDSKRCIGVLHMWYDGPIWVFSLYFFSICNMTFVEAVLDDAPDGSISVWKTKEV